MANEDVNPHFLLKCTCGARLLASYLVVCADEFLHPDHVVPTIEFPAALMERANLLKSQMRMKMLAVAREVFVFFDGVPDAGVQVQDAHRFQALFERFVQRAAVASLARIVMQVDGKLARMAIGLASHEGTGIGVALNRTLVFDH